MLSIDREENKNPNSEQRPTEDITVNREILLNKISKILTGTM